MKEKDLWEYYPRYDVNINLQTGQISLPICSCKADDKCLFLTNWESDGSPTHLEEKELKRFKKTIKDNTEN